MILVDTSVWIDHLRVGDERLKALLNKSQVLAHPFVIGELACGNLRQRPEILSLLMDLPQAPVASQEEVMFFIENNELFGRGIGFVDAHILAATALAGLSQLWTHDKRLQEAAFKLSLATSGDHSRSID
jgi:predicted nucleic acid-binding protein